VPQVYRRQLLGPMKASSAATACRRAIEIVSSFGVE
jgi:hypothetical protein